MPIGLITGASRGFGRALATDLAADGWDLVIDGRDPAALDQAAATISAAARTAGVGVGRVVAITGDVTDPAHRADLVAAAAELGGLDLVVNNASALGPTPRPLRPLADFPLDALADVYAANVIAPLGLIQAALPLLIAAGVSADADAAAGVVVDITSDAGVEAYEGWGGYGSSKAALDQLGNVLAAEHPAVRIYTFDPGDMRTQMHQDAFPGEDISDRPEPETVVPALRRLLRLAPPSGRYRAAELLEAVR